MIEIGGLQKTTLIDYPGRIAATIFIIGCNFRCPFCYSRELVLPEKIKSHPRILEKEIFDFLEKRKGLLEGIVICGGEPTIHEDLPDFIQRIKNLGYLVKLDTNGSNPKMLKKLIDEKMIDYVAMDIKGPREKYDLAAGVKVDIKNIEKTINLLKEDKIDYEFRSTILPQIHTKGDIVKMARWIRGAEVFYLQQFRPEKTIDPEYEKCKPFTKKELKEIQVECNKYVITKLRE